MARISPAIFTCKAILLFVTAVLFACSAKCAYGARLQRAVMMMDTDSSVDCISGTITERNSSTSVVLTGTIKKCNKMRPDKYSCRVQVWRIMKGRSVAGDLVQVQEEKMLKTTYKKSFVEVYGLGNRGFCDSEVKEDKTRIFFLNRVDDRLVLAASLLHITLKNLENTEKVIKGEEIEEPPKKVKDPCLFVLCGFGSKCKASANGTATCVCPEVTCGQTSDLFAPVCATDGVTYPSECRLKAAQCWSQRRLRIISRKPCSPVQDADPCKAVSCGNSAKCVVKNGAAKCRCESCDHVTTRPVCGSNQNTYRSECDLRRAACMEAKELQVVRRAACEPCVVYNETAKTFERICGGLCALSRDGRPLCCDEIPCEPAGDDDGMMICGSDGRTYMSRCAMARHSCKTGRDVAEVAVGSCPSGRVSTVIRGSTSIAADEKCPGGCDESSPKFIKFKEDFERVVNEKLNERNGEDIDSRAVVDFRIKEVRSGSVVLVYSARMAWFDTVIGDGHTPGEDVLWAFQRLHDPANGILKAAITAFDVTLITYNNPADDFTVEEVCGSQQCSHSASCVLSKDSSGGFLHECECSAIGDSNRLSVTLGCKRANNDRFYDNRVAVRRASCAMRAFFTFRDVCRDPAPAPCDDIHCGAGSTCIVTDGVAACECVTCDGEFSPVCGSNGRTYRNMCELNSENCVQETLVTVKSEGMCTSQCDEVNCGHGGQCEELSQGSALCICPSNCVEVYAPVCASDGVTYDNDCLMTVASCEKEIDILVVKRGSCDGSEVMPTVPVPTEEPEISGEGGEGSGDVDGCGCRFGASCDAMTIDDEDQRCSCDVKCENTGVTVCGSNLVTYADECELLKAQCETQRRISITRRGQCPAHCSKSAFGCCEDGVTPAKGSMQAGCPEKCLCDSRGSFSSFCNHTTGQCVCRPGVGGVRCHGCQTGFWNFRAIDEKRSVGCMSCQCEKGGSVRDDCDQMTGQCFCKEGVAGVKCSTCENGGVMTPDGCRPTAHKHTASSCEGLDCQFGQECVELIGQAGRYACQCPPLSSCDTYSNGKVCASNGITYADRCQMRVVSCRESKHVTVLADGACKEYFKSLKPVIPPIVTVPPRATRTSPTTATTTTKATTVASTTLSTTTAATTTTSSTTATTTTTTTTTQAVLVDKEESSGDEDETNREAPPDDEDGTTDMEGSGEDVETATTASVDVAESVVTYKARVTLLTAGSDMEFSADVRSKDSELYAEYSAGIMTKISSILAVMVRNGGVVVNSLRDVEFLPSEGQGVTATFTFDAFSTASMNDLVTVVNENLADGESISFEQPAVRPIDPPDAYVTYVEDGEWELPQFGGSSFMEFPRMEAYSAATIHMKFKSADSEGLLLYNGQEEGRDFISLAIIGGFVEFRFDTGSGQLALRSTVPVNDGEWHRVVSRRNRREGMLKVDNEQEVSGSRSSSTTTGVNLDTNLFVGGFTDQLQDKVVKQTSVSKGLTGCIASTRVGQHGKVVLRMSSADKSALNSYRIAECSTSPCMPNPCKNFAKCFITYQLEEFTYKCACSSKYYGDTCQHRTMKDSCALNPCHESSTCVEDEHSYRCICPESRAGAHCENLIAELPLPTSLDPSYMPMFAGDSYIRRCPLVGVSTQLDIEIVFYTFQLEGLIFYNAQNNSLTGDFISLNLRNGYLEFMYDLGEGPAVITSPSRVALNKWHVAKLSRVMRIGDLALDDQPIAKGKSPHLHSQLNLVEPLYIGFVPPEVTLPAVARITTGLMGAIQKFVVNGVMLPRSLVDEDSTAYHIQAFNGHACYRLPCQNEGTCKPNLGNYTCECKPGYSGKTCNEVKEAEEEESMLQDPQGAVFYDGNVQAQYNNFITRRVHSLKTNNFELQLKTTARDGLLFYDGKASKNGDFIALALNRGALHLVFDLGSGETNLVSRTPVNDGLWKSVRIVRNEHRASLQIDDRTPNLASAPPLTKWLNTDGTLWLGGCGAEHMPSRHRGLPKSFYSGFVGCIRRFRIDGNLLHLREDVLNRPGLATCPNR